MEPNSTLLKDLGELSEDCNRYHRLVGASSFFFFLFFLWKMMLFDIEGILQASHIQRERGRGGAGIRLFHADVLDDNEEKGDDWSPKETAAVSHFQLKHGFDSLHDVLRIFTI